MSESEFEDLEDDAANDDGDDGAVPSLSAPTQQYRDLVKGEETLACLLQGLLGRHVMVELINDAVVRGTLAAVECDCSLALTAASMQLKVRFWNNFLQVINDYYLIDYYC